MFCPLCNSSDIKDFCNINSKLYNNCLNCDLIFLDKTYYLNQKDEKKRYAFHQNNIEDKGYVDFLNQLIFPLKNFLKPKIQGLDFACGPEPVLANLMEKYDLKCDFYDPYFFPKLDKNKTYEFITATECFEHFFEAKKEIELINSLLKPKSYLGIMTEFVTNKINFKNWYYIKDPTHVCFYSLKTFEYLSEKFGFEILYTDKKRVIIFYKNK
ncbi:MAG: class I SAM-dependent methyltransferase [Bacteroidales bacterium]|jgi:hypothetical protein|nr:class I SAM-dependent methyltransferase [Bacteroidales bacterium]MCK9497934.1 class I SAM-dependent methyltransferase [Bacteroidales bacterium]MDY0314700.1 class I SAM-dependent methyltransferase [Bacteroidales bacterium]NLB86759.1 class I SAM-dependent methyltransferase [Bacteroidales bacterium]